LAILPHDGGARNIRGAPVAEQLGKYGIRTEILRLTCEQEGINAVRTLLQTTRFNKTNCKIGIEHLRNFKYKIDKKTGIKLKQTEHNEHSHGADAFRYAVLAKDIWKSKTANVREDYGNVISDYNVFI
jgi:phage terminase large subunit